MVASTHADTSPLDVPIQQRGAAHVKRLWLTAAGIALTGGLTNILVSPHEAARPVHATLLPTPDDALRKLVLKFHVVGSFEDFDRTTGVVTFSFSGPFGATQMDPVTGLVRNAQTGPPLGDIEHASVQFSIDPSKGLLNADSARFTCDQCVMRFNDGSVLQPLRADPHDPISQPDIPMEGRLLLGLGALPGANPGTVAVRGAGCGGAREVAGQGLLANTVGAICMNGYFTLPASLPVTSVGWANVHVLGQSDCTFVFQPRTVPLMLGTR
jgi:hypothetical protein